MKSLAWALLVGFALSACSTAAPHPVSAPVVRPDAWRVPSIPNLGPCSVNGQVYSQCPPRA